jgi:uroporphyrinogen-III synthase
MSKFKLLVTKKISPSLVLRAGLSGVDVLEKEMITISHVVNDDIKNKLKELTTSEHIVVFTSKNAITALTMNGNVKNAPWKIFSMEGATANELKKYFDEKKIVGLARNATALADVIKGNGDVKKVIFFCGTKRLDHLPEMLRERKIQVEEIVVYETQLAPQSIIDDYDAIAFFSPSAAESFFSTNIPANHIVCLSVGTTTTEAIKKYTDNEVITAERPSEESVIQTAINISNKNHDNKKWN